jgi:hypothetical protein
LSVSRTKGAPLGAILVLAGACGGKTSDYVPPASPSGGSAGAPLLDAAGGTSQAGRGGSPSGSGGSGTAQGGSSGSPDASGGTSAEPVDAAIEAGADAAPSCGRFMDLWKVRQSERAPGDIAPAPDQPAPCFECISAAAGSCDLPDDGACSAGMGCVERHCLCVPDADLGHPCRATEYPSDVCACGTGCYPPDQGASCRRRWGAYVECVVNSCAEECSG